MNLNEILGASRIASRSLSQKTNDEKNALLREISKALVESAENIINENKKDLENAKNKGVSDSMLDRLRLDFDRIKAISESVLKVEKLENPVGQKTQNIRPNGLVIDKVKVPIGVIGIIYEARPNVTVDAAVLCLKTGNAVVLRGGSEAINTNVAIEKVLQNALEICGFDKNCVQVLHDTSRETAALLMKANGKIDVLIPRGGKGLINSVIENSTVPVIETGAGNCHVFVDESANLSMANEICFNARAQRPSVCNSAENVLVHEKIAREFLPMMQKKMSEKNVQLRGCDRTLEILPDIAKATGEDFYTEYNDYILSVKVVKDVNEAIEHINQHGTMHSEAIITQNDDNATKFTSLVDAAAVYVNASTRFTDGEEFGLGAEIGISTQKLHARGPMGLEALTSEKYVVKGTGQIRN